MQRRNRRNSRGLCYPGYNWCGPGCSGPGAPTNRVDSCCKKHDECYEQYGPTKRCDEMLLRCLESQMNSRTKMGRDARLFYNIMRIRYDLNWQPTLSLPETFLFRKVFWFRFYNSQLTFLCFAYLSDIPVLYRGFLYTSCKSTPFHSHIRSITKGKRVTLPISNLTLNIVFFPLPRSGFKKVLLDDRKWPSIRNHSRI